MGLGLELDPISGGIVLAQTGYTNLGQIKTDGFDFTARTNFDLGNFGSLRNQLMVGYVADQHTNDNPSYVGQPGAPRIRAGLPRTWHVGDKTGTCGTAYNDVAFVEEPGGDKYMIAVYLDRPALKGDAANAIIADVARAVAGDRTE